MNDTTMVPHTFSFGTATDVIYAPWNVDPAPVTTTRPSGFDADIAHKTMVPETARDWLTGTIVSQPDHAPVYRLAAKLEAHRHTSEADRWPDAVWPDDQAFDDARAFIGCLPLPLIPMPEISLAHDGEINFLWEGDDIYVDLGFYGTGTYSYFARGRDGYGIRGEDIPASEGLPDKIVSLLSV